ncbi:MAG: hypothetical protein HON47_01830 [Candidatus Diapherotrites archaeon]|jgi:hypothetical protein|uniref:Uncharacterized protein n=1 Tax=Candidatus Iainarchaeum sp. TaxID=3101447 RepID=A0A8T5GEW5_9ARCH|nr:hypothetical protein [Candidatus Diapherotrites archaeon]
MRFSDEQKKIAILLLNEPKTEEQLNKQLNIPFDRLMLELKTMVKLNVISKEGYPTKYKLKQDIIDEVQKRKEISDKDAFRLRIRAIIEFKAIEETLLKRHMGKIKEALDKEKPFTIYDVKEAEIVEEGEMYSSFLEVNLSIKDYPSLIRFLFYYGPVNIEIIKPKKLEFNHFEFQEGLMELADIFQKYADFFTKHLNKEELNKFYDDIYK